MIDLVLCMSLTYLSDISWPCSFKYVLTKNLKGVNDCHVEVTWVWGQLLLNIDPGSLGSNFADQINLYGITTSNHIFKREIWDKLTEFTFLKFWNLKISKFQKMNGVNFPKISQINMWFLVNHMWQALTEHRRVRITHKNNQSISTNLINITP